eukprot:7353018-Pyramimonas_sp.AAC.1
MPSVANVTPGQATCPVQSGPLADEADSGPASSPSDRRGILNLPQALAEVHGQLMQAGLGSGMPNFEQSYFIFGRPEPPACVPRSGAPSREVHLWGDAHG